LVITTMKTQYKIAAVLLSVSVAYAQLAVKGGYLLPNPIVSSGSISSSFIKPGKPLAPTAFNDTYGASYDMLTVGGLVGVWDVAERDALPDATLKEGKVAYISSLGQFHIMTPGLTWTNRNNWWSGGSGFTASFPIALVGSDFRFTAQSTSNTVFMTDASNNWVAKQLIDSSYGAEFTTNLVGSTLSVGIVAASTSVPGKAQFAVDGGTTALTAVQGSDARLTPGTTTTYGTAKLAANLGTTAGTAVQASDTRMAVFGISGSGHSIGLVPDPGASAGTTKFLREDGTWNVPAGGGGGGTNGTTLTINGASLASTVDFNSTTPANDNYAAPVTFQYSSGSASAEVKDVSIIKDRTTAATSISNNSTEATLYTYTVPANMMGTNRTVVVSLGGTYLNSSGSSSTLVVSIKFGGTTLYSDITAGFGSSTGVRAWRLDINLNNVDATNVQTGGGTWFVGGSGGATTGTGDISTANIAIPFTFADGAIDTTANKDLVVTFTHSVANANTTITRKFSSAALR
jgi:hypothetical protein